MTDTKSTKIEIRVTPAEKQVLQAAAKTGRKTLSAWLLDVAKKATKRAK
jgi:uncharacterized protein (DUF1778 family)